MIDRNFDIFEIEVKTRTSTDVLNLGDDLAINHSDINESFCDQPAKFAWWATVAAQAKALVDHKKLIIERQEEYLKKTLVGELDAEIREALEMDGERVTETKVTNGIYAHDRYQKEQSKLFIMKEELLELQKNYIQLEIAKDSMNQRKDMLISLGAQLRMESNNADLTMKERAAEVIRNSRNQKGE